LNRLNKRSRISQIVNPTLNKTTFANMTRFVNMFPEEKAKRRTNDSSQAKRGFSRKG
jgi:hypothetical protein